jgi:sporulation protein YlmC with PRC-barrel domain
MARLRAVRGRPASCTNPFSLQGNVRQGTGSLLIRHSTKQQFIAFSELAVAPVSDSHGRPVGEVTDIILDAGDSRIAYIRIRLLTSDGIDSGRVTVPWSAVSLSNDEEPILRIAARRGTLRKLAKSSIGR